MNPPAGTRARRVTGPAAGRTNPASFRVVGLLGDPGCGRRDGGGTPDRLEIRVGAVSAVVCVPKAALAAAGREVGLLCLRAWKSAVIGAVVDGLAGWGQVSAFIPAQRPTDRAGLSVMTTNLRLGQADPQVVVSLATEHDVDVLAVQELTDSSAARSHQAGLDWLLPYRIIAPRIAGAGWGCGAASQ
jgi:endonuclease/exonuclease/phosphatase (EEP) superfamily protein YafD